MTTRHCIMDKVAILGTAIISAAIAVWVIWAGVEYLIYRVSGVVL